MEYSEVKTLEDHKEYMRINYRKWYQNNKEKKKAYQKEYYRNKIKAQTQV